MRKLSEVLCWNILGVLFLGWIGLSSVSAQDIAVYQKFEDFEKAILLNLSEDTTCVINFWATWCAPCVKELPYFEALNDKYKRGAFKQILVSLDDERKLESKVIPFLKKNNIQSQVVILADGKANQWIDRVDPSWSGAIPITLFLRGDERHFYEVEFHSVAELEEKISILNN